MSEMVERVAEALMRSRHPDAPLTYAEVVLAVSIGSDPAFLEGLRRDARAAIEAMREPTEEMIAAGARGSGEDSQDVALGAWEAMIDTALTSPLALGGNEK